MKPENVRNSAAQARGSAWALARLVSAALAFAAVPGCKPSDPLDERVVAGNTLALAMWRNDAPRELTERQMADFDRAVQEIRFHVMAQGTASGSDAVQDATLQMIDRQTVRHVLQQGLGWELDRAEAERSTLEAGMKTNAQMRTRPGDTDSADYLTDLRRRQVVRLQAATDEVNRAREGLAATGMAVPPAPSPAPSQ
jgi:phage tail protein X